MSTTRKIESALPLLIFIICLAIIGGSFLASNSPKQYQNLNGTKIKNLELFSLIHNDDIIINEPVILHVFATWCISCKVDHVKIAEFRKKSNIRIIGVVLDDTNENAISWYDANPEVYSDVAIMKNEKSYLDLGITEIPETFLLAKDQTILFNHNGELKEKDLNAIFSKHTERK